MECRWVQWKVSLKACCVNSILLIKSYDRFW